MTPEEKKEALALLKQAKTEKKAFDALEELITNILAKPAFPEPESIIPPHKFDSRDAKISLEKYRTSGRHLSTIAPGNIDEKMLKGFIVDIQEMPLLFDRNRTCAAKRLFLLFGQKPKTDINGDPIDPIQYTPYFTLMVMGLDGTEQNSKLIRNGGKPVVYEYLTPYATPPGAKYIIDDIEQEFP